MNTTGTPNPNNQISKEKKTPPNIGKYIFGFIILALLIVGAIFFFMQCFAPKSQLIVPTSVGVETNKALTITYDANGTDKVYTVTDYTKAMHAEYYYTSSNIAHWYVFATADDGTKFYFMLSEIVVGGNIQWQVGTQSVADTNAPLFTIFTQLSTSYSIVPSTQTPILLTLLINLLPTLIILGIMIYFWKKMSGGMMGGGTGDDNIFGMGKSQAKLTISNVKFSDVAGIEEEKEELKEIVDYLVKPAKYAAMGARTPKGVILYGPPGTGKTLLAKAVAGEAKVPFFQVSGSAFDDMLVGVGAKRVRDLFTKARKASPSIIFIDEIDSVASKRGKFDMSGGGGVADQTINQLLAEMDGFSTTTGVVVMAATNRLDVLDDAILRPGRFDRHVQVNLPDIREREQILKIHARNKNISASVSFEEVARRTPGMSGAQLENILNEATLLAVRENKTSISMKDIDEGIDRVIAGPAKKTKVITEEERKQISIHEAGHALVGLYLPNGNVVEKITIIPRGMAAGYTVSNPQTQEHVIQTKKELLADIVVLMGGRAAEEVEFGWECISTGASNDLYRASSIARSMVMQLGMSTVSLSQLIPSEGAVNPYSQKLFSEQTALKADDEVEKIIKTSYEQAKAIISEHQDELHLIVKTLLTIETILRTDIEYIHTHKQLPEHVLKQINKVENFDNTAKEENSEVKAEGNTEVPVENKPATEEVKKTDKKPGRKPKSGNNDKKD